MGLTCPSQCTYRLTEVTDRKDLAQQSKQKTLEGPLGRFYLNADMLHRYCLLAIFPFHISKCCLENFVFKCKMRPCRSKIQMWQCVWSDQLYLLCLVAPPRLLLAAALLAVLLISLWLKTLHVPWKTATQSGDIDRATPRWVFLFLPVCGSRAKNWGWELHRAHRQHLNVKLRS